MPPCELVPPLCGEPVGVPPEPDGDVPVGRVPPGVEPAGSVPDGPDPEEVEPLVGELGASVPVGAAPPAVVETGRVTGAMTGAMTGAAPVTLPRSVPTVVPTPDTTRTMPDSGFGVPSVPDRPAAAPASDGFVLAPGATGVEAPATAGAVSVSTAVASPASAAEPAQRAAALGMPDVLMGILDKSNLTASSPKTTRPKIIGREIKR